MAEGVGWPAISRGCCWDVVVDGATMRFLPNSSLTPSLGSKLPPSTSSPHIITPHHHPTSSPHIITPHHHTTSSPHIITPHHHPTSSPHIITPHHHHHGHPRSSSTPFAASTGRGAHARDKKILHLIELLPRLRRRPQSCSSATVLHHHHLVGMEHSRLGSLWAWIIAGMDQPTQNRIMTSFSCFCFPGS